MIKPHDGHLKVITPWVPAIVRRRIVVVLFFLGIFSCKEKNTLFTAMDPEHTGIRFENTINSTNSFNFLDYIYFYNGGGVATGDINNDGLTDIYFSSNQGSNRLYLNKGNLAFEDITEAAGVQGKGNWKTGVTMADVNGDGLLDIYASEVGKYKSLKGHNELFINNGNSTFSERSAEFGLDIEGFNTQASFFDYDKDGDLDMFLVNHSVHSTESYSDSSMRSVYNDVSGDKLFRNNTVNGKTRFSEVSKQAGIISSILGYGLNVIIADFNNDNWDDIYVSNDFHENDYYYINNQNGSFSEQNRQAFAHQSRFSMGSDAGDINNDGWLDIISLDMLPEDEVVLKSSVTDDPLDIYKYKMSYGYHDQYQRNCLQLNVAGGKKFSDIALYAGVAATDWSWSPLMADFDNDGIKDIFITNGIVKRPNDLDYLKFVSGAHVTRALNTGRSADSAAIDQMPGGSVHNYIFQGTADLKFIDQSTSWGLTQTSFSNGAAYADLDNDGDLDLVLNNINAPATIYRNNTNLHRRHHYIDVQLMGNTNNTMGLGARVIILDKGKLQLNYLTATRGFESASAQVLHFGLGPEETIDTLQVIWPDGKQQLLTNVQGDRRLTILQKDARPGPYLLPDSDSATRSQLFKDLTAEVALPYKHKENLFNDFNVQYMIPHLVSTQGPKLAVADVNGDGMDDFYVCGASKQAGKLFLQNNGNFTSVNESVFQRQASAEDVNASFFDADGDGDADLYVVSGGNEVPADVNVLSDRLYLNDGKGNFTESNTIPVIPQNKSAAATADFDKDGDQDIFLGGRVVTGKYGEIPSSYLLLNDGNGHFSFAAENRAPGLKEIGMVTDASWFDFDKDGWEDLVIVGEWMPVTVFKNTQGRLENVTSELGLEKSTGLWNTVRVCDIDEDGYSDLLAGNLGTNSKLQASEQFPLRLYVGDPDNNGQTDQIMAVAKDGKYYTFLGKEDIERILPALIKKKFLGYKSMAGLTVDEVFAGNLDGMMRLSVNTLSSVLLKNNKGSFSISVLPESVQWSPVFTFITGDFNGDRFTDIVAGGNFYGVIPYEGRYDAGNGNVLLRHGSGWKALSSFQSGLLLEGEVRDIKKLRMAGNKILYVVARNNDSLQFFRNEMVIK